MIRAEYSNRKIRIQLEYLDSINGETITVNFKGDQTPNNSNHLRPTNISLQIDSSKAYQNNLNPAFYSEIVYSEAHVIGTLAKIVVGAALAGALLCLCLKNILAVLQIVVDLQIVFLSLGTVINMHPITASLTQSMFILGFKAKNVFSEEIATPDAIRQPSIKVFLIFYLDFRL